MNGKDDLMLTVIQVAQERTIRQILLYGGKPMMSLSCSVSSSLHECNNNNNNGCISIDFQTKCCNLTVLDLSNILPEGKSVTINLEKLQSGCPKLQVLRLANTIVQLANATLLEQVCRHNKINCIVSRLGVLIVLSCRMPLLDFLNSKN